jgi:hypothetical protein
MFATKVPASSAQPMHLLAAGTVSDSADGLVMARGSVFDLAGQFIPSSEFVKVPTSNLGRDGQVGEAKAPKPCAKSGRVGWDRF